MLCLLWVLNRIVSRLGAAVPAVSYFIAQGRGSSLQAVPLFPLVRVEGAGLRISLLFQFIICNC